MGTKDPANVEIEFILPLAALGHRLAQVEAQLRLLNMKALGYPAGREGGSLARVTEAQLDHIDAALDGIRQVLSDLRRDTLAASGSESRSLRPRGGGHFADHDD